jgi:sugar/nucleoside kinase (ribokinase family)
MKLFDVTVVGEIYIDHVFSGFATWPKPGEEVFTDQYLQEIGGGAANTACGLARLGRSVRLVGAIGAADAQWFRTRLDQFGVSSDLLTLREDRTGVTMSVSTTEDRSFFTYLGANSHLLTLLDDEALLEQMKQSRHVHFALPLDPHTAIHILPELRSAGCTTSLDVGFQPAWLSDPESLVACRATDYFLPNEREASIVCGGDGNDYLAFAEEQGLPRGILKLGPRGAAMATGGRRYSVPSPDVTVVDTTGAGDAFDTGFIDALLDGAGPEDCLRRACICGGLSTRTAGALRGLPLRDQIERLYEQTYAS